MERPLLDGGDYSLVDTVAETAGHPDVSNLACCVDDNNFFMSFFRLNTREI